MEEQANQAPDEDLSPELLTRALKAFKKRLKLTRLDEDSRLGGCVATPLGDCYAARII
jgi:hypothetical protein